MPALPWHLVSSLPGNEREQVEQTSGTTIESVFFFCKAQAMIAERKILLCKLLSSGEGETIEIKTLQHHCVYPWRIGEAF